MDDASSFEGPADPEAEALSKAWGPEETFVVLPRLESLRGDGDVPWIEQISWSPRAQVYHNFLTPEECDHLVEIARPRMSVASVVDKKTGASKPSDVRTSTGHFIRRAEDAVVRRIEERIAAFAMVPVDHGEGIQILRYERGQKYDPHFDYFTDDENVKHGGQRVATVLMYLSDVERGGETVFPRGERVGKEHEAVAVFKSGSRSSANDAKDAKDASERRFPSACAAGKLHVAPRKGLRASVLVRGPHRSRRPEIPARGLRGRPGEKWTATKWLRHGPYGAERERRTKARIRRARETDDDEKERNERECLVIDRP